MPPPCSWSASCLVRLTFSAVRIRVDAVRLVDVAVVALAADAHRGVRVGRPGLERRRQRACVLLALGFLADRLDAVGRAAALVLALAALILIRVLLRAFRFAAVADESTLFDCVDVAVVALAEDAHRDVRVARALLLRELRARSPSGPMSASWPIAWVPPEPP